MKTQGQCGILVWMAVITVSTACNQNKSGSSESSSTAPSCQGVTQPAVATIFSIEENENDLDHDENGLVFSRSGKLKIEHAILRVPNQLDVSKFLVDDETNGLADSEKLDITQGTRLLAVVDHDCVALQGAATLFSNEALGHLDSPGSQSHTVVLPYDIRFDELDRLVESDECVEMVSAVKVHKTLAAPTDPDYSLQGHLAAIKYDVAYDKYYTTGGGITADVVIAVIDTGVLLTHEDLAANIWVNPGETAGNSFDDDGNGKVDDINGWNFPDDTADPNPQAWSNGGEKHGTHVAGLAAARMNNLAADGPDSDSNPQGGGVGVIGRNVKIMALNVFGANEGADTTDIDNAIRYAADKGANVINLSIGGAFPSSSTASAISYAIGKGSLVVAAAGNSNLEIVGGNRISPASYGECFSGMIAVGSIDSNTSARSSFSNYSATSVEIGAPGAQNSNTSTSSGGLYSTVSATIYSYQRLSGTSMATPVVAGAAGLAFSLKKTRSGSFPTPAQVETYLTENATISSSMTSFVKEGRLLDLDKVADKIISE